MDLLSILGALWRHKFAALPVMLLTVLGAYYVVVVKAPVYSSSASVLLVSPPVAPTPAQIAANPKLKRLSSNNPYINLGGLPVVADAVISVVTAPTSQQHLLQAGADPRYQITLSTAFGTPPIIQISGVGSSSQAAILSAKLVTRATMNDLYQMQKAQGVNPFYMIRSVELVRPSAATSSVSSKLRTLIALLALGAILLFLVVSVMDVIDRRRKGKLADEDEGMMPGATPRSARYPEPRQSRRAEDWPPRNATSIARSASSRARSRAGRS